MEQLSNMSRDKSVITIGSELIEIAKRAGLQNDSQLEMHLKNLGLPVSYSRRSIARYRKTALLVAKCPWFTEAYFSPHDMSIALGEFLYDWLDGAFWEPWVMKRFEDCAKQCRDNHLLANEIAMRFRQLTVDLEEEPFKNPQTQTKPE